MAPLQKILVLGGNGFIGSAVCRAALTKGMQVTSISSSGKPYRTPKGHAPDWTSKVDWQKGDALHPETFAHLFPEVDGVVHTLGTLIEDGRYKQALKNGDFLSVMQSVFQSGFSHGNPLKRREQNGGSYEVMNRDTALRVCEAFIASSSAEASKINVPRPFVYISAEDIFRPVISERYIMTKREAEQRIEIMMQANPLYHGVYIRPSLVYHPHYRPWTTPAAALLDLSAMVHENMPRGLPTPSSFIRSLGSAFPQTGSVRCNKTRTSPLESIANALTTRPIHVDTVAEAVCVALDPSRGVRGVIGVSAMRELLGWTETRREGGGAPIGLHNS